MPAGAEPRHDPAARPGQPSSGPPFPTGLVLSPFRALRYRSADLAPLTSPPYDVIDDDGVTALQQASVHNIVRLILPRDDPEQPQDRFARAADTLREWRRDGVLVPDPVPALYVYEQAAHDGHAQRGLLGAVALSPAADGIVLPHENTMAGPVSDRLALYEAVDADLEPIFLIYDGGGAASDAVAAVDRLEPLLDQQLPDGLRHRLWALTDPALLDRVAADLHPRRAVIADGHHRYATYLQRQARSWDAGRGPGPWDAGLAFLVDGTAFGPEVHAIHRVVPARSADDLAAAAAGAFRVRDLPARDLDGALAALAGAGERGHAYLLASGDAATLRLLTDPDPAAVRAAMPAERSDAWRSLDVSVLHAYLVGAVWGLDDSPDAVGFEHDVQSALAAASRAAGTAVLLNPTPAAGVAAVAAGGERMPRKSTLFTPKPRTGVVVRDHRDS